MFGDLIFATIPFSIFEDEAPEAYGQLYINICPEVTEWDNVDGNEILTRECGE